MTTSVTTKSKALVTVPRGVVTVTGPDDALMGTLTRIILSLTTVGVTLMPLGKVVLVNSTFVAPVSPEP